MLQLLKNDSAADSSLLSTSKPSERVCGWGEDHSPPFSHTLTLSLYDFMPNHLCSPIFKAMEIVSKATEPQLPAIFGPSGSDIQVRDGQKIGRLIDKIRYIMHISALLIKIKSRGGGGCN